MSFYGEMGQVQETNMHARQVVESNAQMVGATPEMVKFYEKQKWELLHVDRGSRRVMKKAMDYAKKHPEVTTVFWIAGEGGGNGKTARASKLLAKLGFNEELIGDFYEESNGYELQPRYIGMTTVGQDLQKETDENGQQVVDKTAPNWSTQHLLRIRNRLEGTVATIGSTDRLQEMNKEAHPDKRITPFVVVEDLTGFAGVRPFRVTDNYFGIWVLTNSEAQANASRQREQNEKSVELGEVYQKNGGVMMDKPSLVGTDALDFMGNDASRVRAFDRMNRLLMTDEVRGRLIEAGTPPYNFADLEGNLLFRNAVVLGRFYNTRIKDMGFKNGSSAVAENPYVEGLSYNLNLIREMKLDSNKVMGFVPNGSL